MPETITDPKQIKDFLEGVDPLLIEGNKFNTIGDIINQLLKFIYPLAGILLFVMLILGGFDLLTSAGNEEKVKKGQGRITSAVIGFAILFAAYWIMQIIQIILGAEGVFG